MLALRRRQQRNFITTLLLSQGVPMLLGGDELGRTQQGNNNTYCQDSELTWTHWDTADHELVEFTAHVSALRRDHPTFRRRRFFEGKPVPRSEGDPVQDIVWLRPSGDEMTDADWGSGFGRSIGVFLNGNGIRGRDERGQVVWDDNFLLLFNAHDDVIEFTVPGAEYGREWTVVVDTAAEVLRADTVAAGDPVPVPSKAMVVLQTPRVIAPEVPPVVKKKPRRTATKAAAKSTATTSTRSGAKTAATTKATAGRSGTKTTSAGASATADAGSSSDATATGKAPDRPGENAQGPDRAGRVDIDAGTG